jgi:hypothetical protein
MTKIADRFGSDMILARLAAAGVVGLVSLWGATVPAQAQDGGVRSFLGAIGILDREREEIEYRERAPLVVPPSNALPSPEDANKLEAKPSWPRDPDVERRRQAATDRGQPSMARDANGNVLRPDQLSRGATPGVNPNRQSGANTGPNGSRVAPGRDALMPSELGWTGWGSVWAAQNKPEVETFRGEPPRQALTDPPVGLRTPTPSQPYGIAPREEPRQPNPFSRMFSGWGNSGNN